MEVHRFERVEHKLYQAVDLALLLILNDLIPLELRFKTEELSFYKYTRDGLFPHMFGFKEFPFVGIQVILKDCEGKLYQIFLLFKSDDLKGWNLHKKSGFSEIKEFKDSFPFNSLI